MSQHQPLVSLPFIPYYCNLVVFPSPHKNSDVSRFFILSHSAAAPEYSDKRVTFDYIPGSVYCFLPSAEKYSGKITMLSSKPSFVSDFSFPYCLEVNPNFLDFSNSDRKDKTKQPRNQDGSTSDEDTERCTRCFI